MFDGSKSEDAILETISSTKYSGVCFARLEVSVKRCVIAAICSIVFINLQEKGKAVMPVDAD